MSEIVDLIERHGWAIVSVLEDGPGDPPCTYSIGLHRRGLPEVLVVGACSEHAAEVVQHTATALTTGRARAETGTVIDLPPGSPWAQIHLGEVHPRWARRLVMQADADAGEDVAVVQALVPDGAGHAPGHEAVDPALLERQPVLGEPQRPWRLPFGRQLVRSLEVDARETTFALLPILAPDGPLGREELVTVGTVDGASWIVTSQPALADWCTVGTRIDAAPVTTRCPLTADLGHVVRYLKVVRESHWIAHRWSWHGCSEADADRLWDTLDAPTRHPHHRVGGISAMPHAITIGVEPRHGPPLRSSMRRLERDGLVAPRPLFHRREDPDLAARDPRCPCCAAERR